MTKDSEVKNSDRQDLLSQLSLGKAVSYQHQYSPSLLQAVPRALSRNEIGLTEELPFDGVDIWNAYELSWLNANGKPKVAIVQCSVPIQSQNLIESKSFKLYLNSYNQTRFDSTEQVITTLANDLSHCAAARVEINMLEPNQFNNLQIVELAGINIDDIDIHISDYKLTPSVLKVDSPIVSQTLSSNLLKSNCLITNQPDWASVQIRYQGRQINQQSLLRYLISFRLHNEFHEQCVERIFCDIQHYCKPDKLSVYARYTRRGGLDINPFRTNFEFDLNSSLAMPDFQHRSARQ